MLKNPNQAKQFGTSDTMRTEGQPEIFNHAGG